MKYSILVPYYKRPTLEKTLESFYNLYGLRNDYEVIIVKSYNNDVDDEETLSSIIKKFNESINITALESEIDTYSCCVCYNQAAKEANGEYFILTNPESPHKTDILGGLDKIDLDNNYVVCACYSVDNNYNFIQWYQHSKYNNRKFHFCSCISKRNWLRIGGFCEEYKYGISYEDNDFVERIKLSNLYILEKDDLEVLHIEHPREYNNYELCQKNKNLFNYIWDEKR